MKNDTNNEKLLLNPKNSKNIASGSKYTNPKDRKTPLQTKFGQLVREKRLPLELSQEELAERANLHFTYIGSVERGERNISLENIAKLAKALGCSLKDLMPEIL